MKVEDEDIMYFNTFFFYYTLIPQHYYKYNFLST